MMFDFETQPLVIGQLCSREEVARHLGGGHETYLPQLNGRVVGGCFDPKVNPDAPSIVLVGNGPITKAAGRQFASQTQYVPVFMKRDNKQWEYIGNYRASRSDDTAKTLNEQIQRTGRTDITRVLYLEPKP
jgi:hypothetical protein